MARTIAVLIALIGTAIPVGFGTLMYVAAKGLPTTYVITSTQSNESHQFYLNGERKGGARGFCFTTENATKTDENAGENIITLVRPSSEDTAMQHLTIDESGILPSKFVSNTTGSELGLMALKYSEHPELAKQFECQ